MNPNDKRYKYNKNGAKGARVGQAVQDILAKDQPSQTAQDTVDAFGSDFVKELENYINDNATKYQSPFYVFVLTKKEMWTDNVLRNWFIARQTPPHAFSMVVQYPHATKTLYMVDSKRGAIKIIYSLPGNEECRTVIRNWDAYHPELVKWINDAFTLQLDRDGYSFMED